MKLTVLPVFLGSAFNFATVSAMLSSKNLYSKRTEYKNDETHPGGKCNASACRSACVKYMSETYGPTWITPQGEKMYSYDGSCGWWFAHDCRCRQFEYCSGSWDECSKRQQIIDEADPWWTTHLMKSRAPKKLPIHEKIELLPEWGTVGEQLCTNLFANVQPGYNAYFGSYAHIGGDVNALDKFKNALTYHVNAPLADGEPCPDDWSCVDGKRTMRVIIVPQGQAQNLTIWNNHKWSDPLKEHWCFFGEESERIDENNVIFKECGTCWGAEAYDGQCCNTCEEVKQAYQAKNWKLDLTLVEQCK